MSNFRKSGLALMALIVGVGVMFAAGSGAGHSLDHAIVMKAAPVIVEHQQAPVAIEAPAMAIEDRDGAGRTDRLTARTMDVVWRRRADIVRRL